VLLTVLGIGIAAFGASAYEPPEGGEGGSRRPKIREKPVRPEDRPIIPEAPPTPPRDPSLPPRDVVDRVVAVIENDIVTERELEAKVKPYLAQLDEVQDLTAREQRRKQIYRQVLDMEIGERMVTREIERNRDKLSVTEQDIDHAIDEVMKLNNLTRDQLQAALYGQGLTWGEYRKKLREQMERTRLVQFKVQGKVQIKDADVRRRCEERSATEPGVSQVCASHLLVALSDKASAAEQDEKRMKATRLRSELANGADFGTYALKYSDDKGTPDGKLGCFSRGEMVKPFEDAAFALKPGELSNVVRTRFGYHIIKVTDRIAAPTASCTDEKALSPIRSELYQEEMERQMNAWIVELRSKAFVEVKL
jgi:parvulin-like peptidyl-prolyl isomerase